MGIFEGSQGEFPQKVKFYNKNSSKFTKASDIFRYNMTEEDYRMLEVVITAGQPHKAGPQWKVKFSSSFHQFIYVKMF